MYDIILFLEIGWHWSVTFLLLLKIYAFVSESLFHFDSELSLIEIKFHIKISNKLFLYTQKLSKFENSFFLFSSVSSIPFSEGTNWKTITETPIFSLYLHYFAHCFLFFFLDFCLKWLLSSPFFFSSPFPSLPYSSSSFFIIIFFWTF